MNRLYSICYFIMLGIAAQAQQQAQLYAQKYAQIAATFEENKGQVWDMEGEVVDYVNYHYKQGGTHIFMLPKGIAYQFNKTHYPEGYKHNRKQLTQEERAVQEQLEKEISLETYRMDMELLGANPNAEIIAEGKSEDYVNYYNRNTLNVHSFQKLTYKDIYPNIDWVIYTTETGLKYDFVVHAGADPSQIQMQFKHHEGLKINKDGSFTLSNQMGSITEQTPVSFQGEQEVATQFQLQENTISFQLEDYDKTQDLVIDPNLIWATYYGGSSSDYGNACVVDANDNVYLVGYTESTNNIASGGHQNTYGTSTDAFLVKFNNAGVRQWATYYGGNGGDYGSSCAIDANGDVYLVGTTGSNNNISLGGHQNTYGGGQFDAFLVKFNSIGVRQWATYYGGSDLDRGQSCAIDGLGNIYVSGFAYSTNKIASGGHQNTGDGSYLVKFNNSGVRQWGTYYGTSNGDYGYSCAVDGLGNVYLAGSTESSSNIASGGHQNTYGGSTDAFLVKFDSTATVPTNLREVEVTSSLVHISPNPTYEKVTIQSTTAIERLQLYNIQGQLLQEQLVNEALETSLDLQDRPTGIYIVRLEDTQQQIYQQKIIKY